ncbi:meiotically up-regulated protein [Penicillium lividum]|nr:meiotically up-regulated protein [Penicillium lividum]
MKRRKQIDAHAPESTQWLNSLLASVWLLVNPDLFSSLVDTLEDSMQASLPKLVNMINLEDLGQGSEAPRILGVRWIPSNANGRSASHSKNIYEEDDTHGNTDYEESYIQPQSDKPGQYTNDELQREHE